MWGLELRNLSSAGNTSWVFPPQEQLNPVYNIPSIYTANFVMSINFRDMSTIWAAPSPEAPVNPLFY